ncbi:MAG: hypothetical protein R2764_24420 [Bacteroidales bacterium]
MKKKLLVCFIVISVLQLNYFGFADGNEYGDDFNAYLKKSNYSNSFSDLMNAEEFTVPLYTIKYKDIEIPILLKYNSTGIQVNDFGGIVGTNWELIVGGQISRYVNHIPDDQPALPFADYDLPSSNEFYYLPQNQRGGWLRRGIVDGDNDGVELNEYIGTFGEEDIEMLSRVKHDILYNTVDMLPDQFQVSVPGLSENFFINRNGNVCKTDLTKKINIEQHLIEINDNKFIITDENGYTYYFIDGDLVSPFRRVVVSEEFDPTEECDKYADPPYYSNYKLVKIVTPYGEEINFDFDGPLDDFNYVTKINADQKFCGNQIVCAQVWTHQATIIKNKVIHEIETPDESIIFTYHGSVTPDIVYLNDLFGNYISTADFHALRVEKIEVYNKHTGAIIKQYSFNYEELRDRFYLKRINNISSDGDYNLYRSFEYGYNDPVYPPYQSYFDIDYFGFWNGHEGTNANHLIPLGYSGNCQTIYNSVDRTVDLSSLEKGILTKIVFPLGKVIKFQYTNKSETPGYPTQGTRFAGGLILDAVEYYDEDGLKNIKNYAYSNLKGYVFNDIELDFYYGLGNYKYSNPRIPFQRIGEGFQHSGGSFLNKSLLIF